MDLSELEGLQETAAEYQAATTNLLSSNLFTLFSKTQTLQSSLDSLSHTVASQFANLKQENQNLRSVIEDQDRAIGDLSKELNPAGCWVWTRGGEGREEGRWRWTLKKGPSSFPCLVAPRGPPIFLPSLPVELLSAIANFLEHEDKLQLALVCFRFFDLLADELYSKFVSLNEDIAVTFAKAKFSSTATPSPRLACLRTIKQLILRPFSHLSSSSPPIKIPPTSSPPLRVEDLAVEIYDLEQNIQTFSPLLALLHPIHRFVVLSADFAGLPPSLVPVPASLFHFTARWSSLRRIEFQGRETVPCVKWNSNEVAMVVGGSKLSSFYLWTVHNDGTNSTGPFFPSAFLQYRLASYITVPRIDKVVALAWVRDEE